MRPLDVGVWPDGRPWLLLEFVEPAGVVAAGNGEIFVVDSAADPFGNPDDVFHGAVFRIDSALTFAVPVSSTADFEELSSQPVRTQ